MPGGMTDTRILQLQFENRQFERNIAQSKKSIDELKEAMDFEETSKGLEKFSRSASALNFSGIENNLQKLADKFTGLGNVGEYVISRIRASIEGAARSMEYFIKSMSIGQISVGQSKYDALNKSVQTIIAGGKYTEKEAYSVMERVMAYTDQTSHSFSTMVGQISSLQSIGMGLQEAERFLEGVANASTKAGAGATEAAGAMAIMSKVMGGQKLARLQFDSLNQTYRVITEEWRNMAIEAALATGDLVKVGEKVMTGKGHGKQEEVTAKNLENTLAKGWFTPAVAKELYKNYQFGETIDELRHPEDVIDSFGKTAYLTGQRALTFADALNAVKESVSSGWLETFRIVFGDVTEAMATFTDMCDRVIESIEGIKTLRNDILRSWRAQGGRDSLMDILLGDYWKEEGMETGAIGFLDVLDGVKNVFRDGIIDFFSLFADPDDAHMFKEDPTYFAAWLGIKLANITKGISDFMKKIKDFFNAEIEVNGKTTTRLELIKSIVDGIAGVLFLGYQIMSGVVSFISEILSQLDPSFKDILAFFGDLGAAIFNTADNTNKGTTIVDFFKDLAETLKPITDGINSIIHPLVSLLRLIFGLDGEDDDFSGPLGAFGTVLKTVADIIAKVAGPILKFIGDILTSIDKLARGEINLEDFGKALSEAFSNMLITFVDNLPDNFSFLGNWIKDLFGLWEDDGEDHTKSFFGFLNKLFTTGFNSFNDLLKGLTSGMSLTQFIKTKMGFGAAFDFLTQVAGWFKGTNLYGVIMAFLGVATVATIFRLVNQARKAVYTIGGFFDDVGGNLKAGVLGHYEWFSEKLFTFAKSILMIAAAIALLGSLKPSSLLLGTAVVALIMFAMFKMTKQIENMKGTYGQQLAAAAMFDSMAAGIVAITLSLSVLMLAMLPLSSDWRKMLTAFLGFTGILAALGAFIILMIKAIDKYMVLRQGGNSWAQIGKVALMLGIIAGAFVILSASLGALMLAITPLAAMSWQSILAATGAIMLILTGIGTFLVVMLQQMDNFMMMKFGDNGWRQIAKMGVMMLALSVFIVILSAGLSVLIVAMAPLAAMSWQGILAATVAVGAILAEIGAFIIIMMQQLDHFMNGHLGADNWKQLAKVGIMMIALSAAVAILSAGLSVLIVAITPLAAMSWQSITAAVLGVGVILAEIGVFMILMLKSFDNFVSGVGGGGTTWGGIGKATVMMLSLSLLISSMSLSLAQLILAITPLALMSPEGVAKAVIGLGAILLELSLFMKSLTKMTVNDKGASIKIAGFAAFAVSIGLLVMALTPLALMTWNAWARSMAGLGVVLLELVGFMWLTSKLPTGATSKMVGFAAFAASIGILILALTPLAGMDWGGWAKAMGGLVVVLLELIGFMWLTNKLPSGSTSKMIGFIGFAASIAILLFALKPLSEMSPQGYAQALTGLAAVMLGVIVLMSIMKEVQPDLKQSAATVLLLAGLGASLILFGIAFNEIKDVPWQAILAFSAGIAAIITALGFAAKVANALSIKGILLLALGLAAILGVVALMAPLLIGSVAGALTNLASNFTLISNLMSSASSNANNVDEGGIDKIIRILGKMKDLFVGLLGYKFVKGSVDAFTESCAALNLICSEIRMINAKIGNLPEDGGMGKLQTIVEKVKGILSGPMNGIDAYYGTASSFNTIMYQLGTALGTFESVTKDVGDPNKSNAIKTIQTLANSSSGLDVIAKMNLDNLTAGIAGLGGAMMLYAQGAQEVGSLDNFDPEGKDAPNVEAAVKLMTAVSTSLAEAGGFTIPGNMPDETELGLFGSSLAALAAALVKFEQAGAGLGDGTKQALNTLTFFRELKEQLAASNFAENWAAIQSESGDAFTKDQTSELTLFGANISQLAQSMGQFAQATTYVDKETNEVKTFDFSKATDAMTAIAELPGKMPQMGGVLDALIGQRITLTQLSEQIELLGSALGDFHAKTSETNNGITTEFKYDNAIDALTKISEIPGKMPVKPGWIPRLWQGEPPDLTKLSTDIIALGGALNQFSKDLQGDENTKPFDPEIVGPAVETLDPMVETMKTLKDKLPKLGGIGNFFKNIFSGKDYTFEELGKQIGYLGDGLGKFSLGVSTGNWSDTTAATNALDAMDSLITLAQKVGSMELIAGNAYSGLNSLASFMGQLTGDIDYSTENGLAENGDIIDRLTLFMLSLDDAMQAWGDTTAEMEGMKSRMDVFRMFAEGISALSNSNLVVDWSFIGTKLTTGIAGSIITGTTSVVDAMKSMLTSAYALVSSTDGSIVSWESIGTAIDGGVARGIMSSTSIVNTAATLMAWSAYFAAMSALKARSPSKLFADVGSYIGLGMAMGINNTDGNVVDAATGMSESAINTAESMMATISRIMAEGADANPTITPVLDLSQVEAGMSDLNGSFGKRKMVIDPYTSTYNASQIGRTRSESGSNNVLSVNLDGIYERMSALGQQIQEMGESIKSMQIVLDTGVVAGGVTDGVDTGIGRNMLYSSRRN